MQCERCGTRKALYRVCSDILDIRVCEPCAVEAQQLGIVVRIGSSNQAADEPRRREGASTAPKYLLGFG